MFEGGSFTAVASAGIEKTTFGILMALFLNNTDAVIKNSKNVNRILQEKMDGIENGNADYIEILKELF